MKAKVFVDFLKVIILIGSTYLKPIVFGSLVLMEGKSKYRKMPLGKQSVDDYERGVYEKIMKKVGLELSHLLINFSVCNTYKTTVLSLIKARMLML